MEQNTGIPDVVKVTMNMSGKTVDDIGEISRITGNSNRTNIVGTAIRVYRKLLELQEKEKAKLIIEDNNGKMTRVELIH